MNASTSPAVKPALMVTVALAICVSSASFTVTVLSMTVATSAFSVYADTAPAVTTGASGCAVRLIVLVTGALTCAPVPSEFASVTCHSMVRLAESCVGSSLVLSYVTEPMAHLYRIVPVSFRDNTLTVAMCDPQKLSVVDELRSFLGYEIKVVVSTEHDVLGALDRYYTASAESVEQIIADLEGDDELAEAAKALESGGAIDLTSVEALADSAPVRKLLNMVLLLGIKDHASDLHFEPFENEFKIRLRSDGVLYEMVPPPRHLAFAITTRIKVMADLDIAERRLPQDGRIRLSVGGHPVDLRVSVMPTMFGESVVMRILDRSVVMLDLEAVGIDAVLLPRWRELINLPHGILLVTGPTGSGKTTTLYGALNELNRLEDKIITTEDPVEYDIEGIIQIAFLNHLFLDQDFADGLVRFFFCNRGKIGHSLG